MSKKASPAAIGGFVLGALALLVAAIIVFSGGQLLRDKSLFVSYFPGTVAGLNVGAPVQFRGVQVGQVTDVKLDFYRGEHRFSIPVSYEIWADVVRERESAEGEAQRGQQEVEALFRSLVENSGLRAVLSSTSLVTGQYAVSLELRPGSDYRYVNADPDAIEIPTVESARDRMADVFQDLDLHGLVASVNEAMKGISAFVGSDALRKMPGSVEALVTDTRALVNTLDTNVTRISDDVDATLGDYRTLATTATGRIGAVATALEEIATKLSALSADLEAKLDPLSRSALATLEQVQQTAKGYEAVVDPQSATRANLDQLLEEAAGAARSLRILADYLEQNPDALIKGKY